MIELMPYMAVTAITAVGLFLFMVFVNSIKSTPIRTIVPCTWPGCDKLSWPYSRYCARHGRMID